MPAYETQRDRDNEDRIAAILSERWDRVFHKMPQKYTLDWAVIDETAGRNRVAGFAELKCRTKHTMEQYGKWGGVFLALNKAVAAKAMCEVTQLPFVFVVEAADGLYYATFKEIKFHEYRLEWSGRTDRNDKNDIEPNLMIQPDRFIQVKSQ